jgi:hypothetical protein
MKSFFSNNSNNHQIQILTALILGSILSVGSAFTTLESASAAPVQPSVENASRTVKQDYKNSNKNHLPRLVAEAVLKDVYRVTGNRLLPLKIVESSKKTWTNGCLGRPKAGELCTQVLVPGWRVIVSDGSKRWIYRTNGNGNILRLETADNGSDRPTSGKLPKAVKNAVLNVASAQLNIPTSQLYIVQEKKRTWNNGCLEIYNNSRVACTNEIIPGYRVVVGTKGKTLVYHTNDSGSIVKFNEKDSEYSSNILLPESVKNAVFQQAKYFPGLGNVQLNIASYEKILVDGCLGLSRPEEACTKIALQAWKVTVKGGRQTLVYHAHPNAKEVRLNEKASKFNLSEEVASAVINQARKETGLSTRVLNIVKFRPQSWAYGCEQSSFPYGCDPVAVNGWEVTVGAGNNRWVFLTDANGVQFKLAQQYKEDSPNAILPKNLAQEILIDASEVFDVSARQLNISQVENKQWSDSCLGLYNPGLSCALINVPGWRVSVRNGQENLIYRVAESGLFKLDRDASTIAINNPGNNILKPVVIPSNELPPTIGRDIVFRQISSGGITGRTLETILMKDGRLMQYRLGDSNDSERSVRWISQDKVRAFVKLLDREGFNESENLRYPAPGGAADYLVYTITSGDTTVQYNDISAEKLPKKLRVIVQAWNQISNS